MDNMRNTLYYAEYLQLSYTIKSTGSPKGHGPVPPPMHDKRGMQGFILCVARYVHKVERQRTSPNKLYYAGRIYWPGRLCRSGRSTIIDSLPDTSDSR